MIIRLKILKLTEKVLLGKPGKAENTVKGVAWNTYL